MPSNSFYLKLKTSKRKAVVALIGLTGLVFICWETAAQAQNQGQNFDRQALIERFKQARANGTLGRGGNRGRGAWKNERASGQWSDMHQKTVSSSNNVAYGNGPLEKLDVYYPKDRSKGNLPIVVFLHGGGWSIGDKRQHGSKGALFAHNGIIFVNANYGLAPEVVHPEQVLDVAKAIKYAVDHAQEWGGDPERIFLMGHSAGAHLVDLVATNQRFLQEVGVKPTSIKGVISLDTASLDLLKRTQEESMEGKHVGAMIEQAFGKSSEMLKDGSPTLNIHKGAYYPPFLMYCGERRRSCIEQHKEFAHQLKNVGAKVAVKPVPLSHRDINLAAGDGTTQIFRESKAFIESGNL